MGTHTMLSTHTATKTVGVAVGYAPEQRERNGRQRTKIMNAIVPAALVPTDMDQAIRLAKAMSDAKMLPKHLQGDVGTCLMIVEQAMRWGMSPFAVAQC